MIRRYTNVSGSPEIKLRRQSPVIGGARLYPGSTVSFSESEFNLLDEATKHQLDALVAMNPPVLDYEEIPDPLQQKIAPVAGGEVAVEEVAEGTTEETENEDTGEGTDEKLGGAVDVTEETPEESSPSEQADTSEDVTDAGESPDIVEEVEAVEEVGEVEEPRDDFDYNKFLDTSIKNIKDNFEAIEPKIDVAKLIECEKASESPRRSLIVWLEQYAD